MLNNLLSTNNTNQQDAAGLPGHINNNKPAYLFSDIIRLVGANQSESIKTNDSVSSNSVSINFKDILGEVSSEQNIDNKSVGAKKVNTAALENNLTVNDSIANDYETQTTVSASHLKSFLKDLFDHLSKLGFVLNGIKGNQNQSINSLKAGLFNIQSELNNTELKSGLKNETPLLLNIDIQENGNKATDSTNIGNNKSDGENDKAIKSGINLNQAIFNILQSNKPVILNFDFANEPVQIKISNGGKATAAGTNPGSENISAEKFFGSLLNQISNGTFKHQTLSASRNNGNRVLLVDSAQGNEKALSNLSGENLPSKVDAIQASGSGPVNAAETVTGNNFKITAVTGNKSTSLTDIQDLEQFLSKLNTSGKFDAKIITPKKELFFQLDNSKNKNISTSKDLVNETITNSGNKTFTKSSGLNLKTLYENKSADNLEVQGKNAQKTADLNKVQHTEHLHDSITEKITSEMEKTKSTLNQQKIPAEASSAENLKISTSQDFIKNKVPTTNNNDNINHELRNSKDSQDKILSSQNTTHNLNRGTAENIHESIKITENTNIESDPVSKLSGAVQNVKQESAETDGGKTVNNNKTETQISTENKLGQMNVTKANLSGGETGKEANSGKRQNDESKILSAQMLNADKQSAVKTGNTNQNVTQFNNIYKTIKASDLISEISRFIGQGKSKSIELKLKPDDLGKVKISLDVVDKAVHANIEVENETVKQMVQVNINNLKQSLTQNGLQLSNLSVSVSNGEDKSNKSFAQKRKASNPLFNKKIENNPNIISSKNMGYNTYEYLI